MEVLENEIKSFRYYSTDQARFGRTENPQIASCVKGSAGDTVEFNITVVDQQITQISFHVEGSKEARACAAVIAELMDQKYICETRSLNPLQVINCLTDSPLPVDHWAILAVRSFNQTMEQVFYKEYLSTRFNF